MAYCNNNANVFSATTINKILATTIESSSTHHPLINNDNNVDEPIINDNNEDGYIGNNYNNDNNSNKNSSNKNIFNPNICIPEAKMIDNDSTINLLLDLYDNDDGNTEHSTDEILTKQIDMRFNKLSQERISFITGQSEIIKVAIDLDEKQRSCFITTDVIYVKTFKFDDLILSYVRNLQEVNSQDKYFVHNIEEFYKNKWTVACSISRRY
jgi:hypothetical protein